MRLLFAALLVFMSLLPAKADAQTIRTLIVAVDNYQYSANPDRKAAFKDLKGAVNDGFRFKRALTELYQFKLDPLGADNMTAENCAAETDLSITLVNLCARREGILSSLDNLIARSKPGDTVLFYFAGHGSQYPDDTDFDQASGYNGTILPTDAREPSSIAKGDILDKELKTVKDRAIAAGVYFVTIFDSCNSGTATRSGASGHSRSVPPLTTKPPIRAAAPLPNGPGGGYWVHLAAAQDGEQAQEVAAGAVGKREGVFTTALIETLYAMPNGTFGDIIREIRVKVALGGHSSQTPMAEGSLTASLGSTARRAALFEAKLANAAATINAGRLSGMMQGSRFALFANEADAVMPNAIPRATGRINLVDEYSASLELDGANLAVLPSNMVAVETERGFGDFKLRIGNVIKKNSDRQGVQVALDKMPFVASDGGAVQAQVAPHPKKPTEAVLLASDGTAIGDLGTIDSTGFADRLSGKLKKILRAQQLLDLRTETDPKTSLIRFCIDDSAYPAPTDGCPPPEKRQMRVLKHDIEAIVTVNNEGDKPLYFYVFGIDPSFGVALVLPQPGAVDPAVNKFQPYRNSNDPMVPTARGTYRFVTIATERPINAAALEQEGTNSRSGAACRSPLERLLCDANKGVRDAATPRSGDWKAIVESVIVE